MWSKSASPRRFLRWLVSGLLIAAILALLAFALSCSDDAGPEDGAIADGTAQSDAAPGPTVEDVRQTQAQVFSYLATVEAVLRPTPTPEPTATPEPSPEEIGAAELPYATPPPGVAYRPDERWVAVNVTTQRAYAFVGGQAVRVALVTTGMTGFETPLGEFRIFLRRENETMDSETIRIPRDDPLGYYLEDVYFTQYFHSGVALHYNYWRPLSYFGNVPSSHGCVGMVYSDAKFFWDFATNGTRVVVYK